MEPLISVIVPVYNGQEYLRNCIESIEKQTYSKIEIIIVNDGSTDQTENVCTELVKKYANIYVVSMNDKGVSAARNAGIKKAGGDYLMFVDADDRLHPELLRRLYHALVGTGSDIAGCDFFCWSSEDEWNRGVSGEKSKEYSLEILHRDEALERIAKGKDTRCWGKLYTRKVIADHAFVEGLTIGEDMIFLLDVLPCIKKMALLSFAGYGYYQNPLGAMNREFSLEYMDQIRCWEMVRDRILQMDYTMKAQVTANLLMAIMLTIGKIAFLSFKERKEQKKNIDICRNKIQRELQVENAFENLPKGYRVKIKLFDKNPTLYLWLYHFHKYL